ncbi:MAG: [FeFe] hydrogenase, group A [Candidatus Pacebacteria bacterium]|nr:[FeFe] hydrogenase, group A [Candidatus Paceibacterota bacterium]
MEIKIKINNKEITAQDGKTILEIAKENNIHIPSLCYHSDLTPKASCRLCLVNIKGINNPQTSCSIIAQDGMEIETNTPELAMLRKTNLELLSAQHKEECPDCVLQYNCQLLKLAKELKADILKFSDRKKDFPLIEFGPSVVFDSSKCIDCRNCVEACANQSVGYLEIENKKGFNQITPSKTKSCIYCGLCITHCPVGALEAKSEFEQVEEPLKNKNKILVFQFAPSIRSSIGEEFEMPQGAIVTDQLVGAIKQLGADYVFDVSCGADFTTFEEAKEMVEKFESGKPSLLMSSCCPAWVRFVEKYYPEFIPNIATSRPPHIILGGLIKTYWAAKEKISPKKIFVVSIMPCVAKKYEITRKEMLFKYNGANFAPVDYVLTTRELAYLLKKRGIDLAKATPQKADNPFGEPSGSGVIYGASGGVMESAIRTATKILGNNGNPVAVDFPKVRGQEGIKVGQVELNGKILNVAAVSGTGNAKIVLEQLKKNPDLYQCVEVMACPGGCIGGGGQPLPQDKQIRQKRAQALYNIDEKKKTRTAFDNPDLKKIYKDFLKNEKIIKQICHTEYKNPKS